MWRIYRHSLPMSCLVGMCGVIFKHKTAHAYLVADAYRGDRIKKAIVDFLGAAVGNGSSVLKAARNLFYSEQAPREPGAAGASNSRTTISAGS